MNVRFLLEQCNRLKISANSAMKWDYIEGNDKWWRNYINGELSIVGEFENYIKKNFSTTIDKKKCKKWIRKRIEVLEKSLDILDEKYN